MREWDRYAITINRSEADLVFVVRKGRVAGAQLHGGVHGGSHPQPGQTGPGSGPGTSPTLGTDIGARGEVGPPDDLFRVYLQHEGQLTSKVWERSSDGGLDARGWTRSTIGRCRRTRLPTDPPPPKKP